MGLSYGGMQFGIKIACMTLLLLGQNVSFKVLLLLHVASIELFLCTCHRCLFFYIKLDRRCFLFFLELLDLTLVWTDDFIVSGDSHWLDDKVRSTFLFRIIVMLLIIDHV